MQDTSNNKELKTCSRCHTTKLLEYFGTNTKGELFKTCNNCRKNDKKYKDTHKDEIKEKNKKYREENKEELKEKDKERHKIYRENNKDKINEYRKKYYEKNAEKFQQYRDDHREERNEYFRQHRIKMNELYKDQVEEPKETIVIQQYLCKCGICYTDNSLPIHLKHYRHRQYLKQQEQIL